MVKGSFALFRNSCVVWYLILFVQRFLWLAYSKVSSETNSGYFFSSWKGGYKSGFSVEKEFHSYTSANLFNFLFLAPEPKD